MAGRSRKIRLRTSYVNHIDNNTFYTYLGRYSNYANNPNGYFPYPPPSGTQVGIFISPAMNYPI